MKAIPKSVIHELCSRFRADPEALVFLGGGNNTYRFRCIKLPLILKKCILWMLLKQLIWTMVEPKGKKLSTNRETFNELRRTNITKDRDMQAAALDTALADEKSA